MLVTVQVVYRVPGQGVQSAYHDSVMITFGENQEGELLIKDAAENIIATYQEENWLYWQVSQ